MHLCHFVDVPGKVVPFVNHVGFMLTLVGEELFDTIWLNIEFFEESLGTVVLEHFPDKDFGVEGRFVHKKLFLMCSV